jgi:hypothetical protein
LARDVAYAKQGRITRLLRSSQRLLWDYEVM